MNRRQTIKHYIRRAKRSLNIEHALPKLQYGILLGFVLCAAILLVSRLFVFPYYRNVALYVAIGVLVLVVIFTWWKRVREKEALHRLDSFYPHNELVTALSLEDETNPLIHSIMQKCVKDSPSAFERFTKRKKILWKPKVLIGIILSAIVIGGLSIFPSATQREALVFEKEQKVIDDLEKEVAELEKKTETKETEKQLQELSNKLNEVETSEEALREVVKKQKELKLQEQKLKEKEKLASQDSAQEGEGLTDGEQKQLEELMELQNELANTANTTQTALSKLGKPVSFDLQNAISSELGSESASDTGQENAETNEQSDSSSSEQESEGQQGNSQSNSQGSSGSQNQRNGGTGQSGQGQGSGSQSQGSGQGSGGGSSGTGNGGSGAGLGQGSRDLLSIPKRVGGSSETTVDGGPLGAGTAVGEQKGPVPVTKGTIRPYEEVIGDYKESFLESSERMQLPKDLQDIVQSYFSSIESE